MKKSFLFLVALMCLSASCLFAVNPAIEKHVAFLQSHTQDPVEYVVSLFEKHKIVVFCETLHPEMTQYEFLMKVLQHPKFAGRVKAVFTEYGSRTQQAVMDRFLTNSVMNVADLIHINQENTFHPCGWSNRNILLFWQELWKINSTRSLSRKVWAYLTDIAWDWSEFQTPADFEKKATGQEVIDRDMLMAKCIAARINQLEAKSGTDGSLRKSYLVIMNTRHALGNAIHARTGKPGDNTGRYLKEAFGNDAVHCVLYHAPRASVLKPNPSGVSLIADGKWDAAFHQNACRPAGFLLANSPFGDDAFDYHSVFSARNYAAAFDSLVFVKPVDQFYRMSFFEGFYTKEFLPLVAKRCALAKQKNVIQGLIDQFGYDVFTRDIPLARDSVITQADYQKQFQKWLE